jgi:hypothetical protein
VNVVFPRCGDQGSLDELVIGDDGKHCQADMPIEEYEPELTKVPCLELQHDHETAFVARDRVSPHVFLRIPSQRFREKQIDPSST